jgi:hypothetical protein
MRLLRAILISVLCALGIQSTAAAEDPASSFLRLSRIPEYRVEREGSITRWPSPAQAGARAGITAFHKVYERWPISWAEVVESGIWQTPLRSYDGAIVNPDDLRNDFAGDVYYDVSGDHPKLVFAETHTPDGPESMVHEFSVGGTYSGQFAKMGGEFSTVANYLQDEKRMVQFGILSAARSMLIYHKSVFGDYPKSMEEFRTSGLSPVDSRSVNPVTGRTFKFDGSANDVYFKYIAPQPNKDGKMIGGCLLNHVNEDGQVPALTFSY